MKIVNKKAHFNYQIEEKAEAGIVLTGGEAHAIRDGHINLSNSYAKILSGEVFLVNAIVPITGAKEYNQSRSRKLLLNKREIIGLESKIKAKRLTLVPISVYTKARLIKVELGLAKSKREFEKKKSLREKDIKRDIQRELK